MNDLLYADAIAQVIHRVRERNVPAGCASTWDSIVSQFKRQGGCDFMLIDTVEEEIARYLASVRKPSLRRLWSWCAKGMAESTDQAAVSTQQMRAFLEAKFFDCIVEIARDEAGLRW